MSSPFLKLPTPTKVQPPKGRQQYRAKPTKLSADRQGQRLGRKFGQLDRALSNGGGLELREDPYGIAPERALVFEVAQPFPKILNAIRKIPDLELLLEDELEFEADDDFKCIQVSKNKAGEKVKEEKSSWEGSLYLMMPSEKSLKELLALWKIYQEGSSFPHGKTQWRDLFSLLKDIRTWGPKDRLSENTIQVWEEELSVMGGAATFRFEAELWSSASEARRSTALSGFCSEIEALGGRILARCDLPEIRYLAVLAEIDSSHIDQLKLRDGSSFDRLQYVRTLSPQTMVDLGETTAEAFEEDSSESPEEVDGDQPPPTVVLLDGVPVQNHKLLEGRIELDDPDDFQARTPVSARMHGTSMASLILHGDRVEGEASPLKAKLVVSPILVGVDTFNGVTEGSPEDELFVDVIHRAVKRLLEGDGSEPPVCPSALIFNLSVGVRFRQFSGLVSPLARLLDHLSVKYGVLFVVSAGNVGEPLYVNGFRSLQEFLDSDPKEREKAILSAVDNSKWERSIMSPAESVNAITVGAGHHDNFTNRNVSPNSLDPFSSQHIPNLSSALGLGVSRSIKPDILERGGREFVRYSSDGETIVLRPMRANRQVFGLRAACSSETNPTNSEGYFSGTSVATALLTRNSSNVLAALAEVDLDHRDRHYQAVMTKALICHSALWDTESKDAIDAVLKEIDGRHYTHRNADCSRLFGYGFCDTERILELIDSRATLVATGDVSEDMILRFEAPLPPSLNSRKDYRRIIFTVAWFTPINPISRNYRTVSLTVEPASSLAALVGVDKARSQPYKSISSRGTIFHDCYEGEKAVAFTEEDSLKFDLKLKNSGLDFTGTIPFGLAVTIETEQGAGIPVYQEVQQKLEQQVRSTIREEVGTR